jgi:hypothetical protein
VDLEEPTSHAHQHTLALVMALVWLQELAFQSKIQNLSNSIQLVFMEQVVSSPRDAEVRVVSLETAMVRDSWKDTLQLLKISHPEMSFPEQ